MSIFDKFDSQVNMAEIEKQKAAASENNYEEVPAGKYIAKIEKMELGGKNGLQTRKNLL